MKDETVALHRPSFAQSNSQLPVKPVIAVLTEDDSASARIAPFDGQQKSYTSVDGLNEPKS